MPSGLEALHEEWTRFIEEQPFGVNCEAPPPRLGALPPSYLVVGIRLFGMALEPLLLTLEGSGIVRVLAPIPLFG